MLLLYVYVHMSICTYVDIRTSLCQWDCCSVVKSLSDHTNVPNYFALGAPPLSLMVLIPLALIVVLLPVLVWRWRECCSPSHAGAEVLRGRCCTDC